jgi:ATP-dependent protease ClpP protease subunit
MNPPNNLFNADPARGIFITREIDHSLFRELFPQILKLRQTDEKICVYIDSPGGRVFFADLIASIIRCPDQKGKQCPLIAVGMAFAGSCAADFLALGDYSIVYPFCRIHYHGTRQQSDDITLQKIPYLAGSLRSTNEQYALRLAGKMFRRMTFLIIEIALAKKMQQPQSGSLTQGLLIDVTKMDKEIEGFEKELTVHLASLNGETQLYDDALSKRKKFGELVESIRASEKCGNGIDVKNQAALFKHLIDLESKANPNTRLTDLLPVIEDDYQQLVDFFFGKYQKDLHAIIAETDFAFLSPTEAQKYQTITDRQTQLKFVIDTVSPRLEPLWFLAVSLARTLQEGEFPMTSIEAYWLGLVDEVINSGLPCLRIRTEQMQVMAQKMLEAQQKQSGQQAGGK